MKQYKELEILLNALLIGLFILVFGITQSYEYLFMGYIIVGGVQLISMLIHLLKAWFPLHKLRVGYYLFLLMVGILIPSGLGLWFLLYASPLMATFYVFICYREWQALKWKELVHLK